GSGAIDMTWTLEQVNQHNERVARGKYKAGPERLPSSQPQPAQGGALDSGVPGEATGRVRTRIVFTVYSCQPCDWDGYSVKQIQDCLVKSGLLDSDDWDQLQGEVISEKVHTREEERTEIVISHARKLVEGEGE